MSLKNYLQYKCFLNSNKKDMKLCGIYYKNNKKYIRLLGHNNLVYTITINNIIKMQISMHHTQLRRV